MVPLPAPVAPAANPAAPINIDLHRILQDLGIGPRVQQAPDNKNDTAPGDIGQSFSFSEANLLDGIGGPPEGWGRTAALPLARPWFCWTALSRRPQLHSRHRCCCPSSTSR